MLSTINYIIIIRMNSAYTERKSSRGSGNFKTRFSCIAQKVAQETTFGNYTSSTSMEPISFKEEHAEKMRTLHDMKMRSWRTGVSSTRIRQVTHKGWSVNKKNKKSAGTKKHQMHHLLKETVSDI